VTFELWRLTFELDPDEVKMKQLATYLGQRSVQKLLTGHADRHTGPIALSWCGPLIRLMLMKCVLLCRCNAAADWRHAAHSWDWDAGWHEVTARWWRRCGLAWQLWRNPGQYWTVNLLNTHLNWKIMLTATSAVLWPLYRATCVSRQHQLRTEGFC